MQKKEWVQRIDSVLSTNKTFSCRLLDSNKAPLLFACDFFRRRRFAVNISLEPTHTGAAVLNVCIQPQLSSLEFTVRRDQTPESIIEAMVHPSIHSVSVRGCGTVVNTVCRVVEIAIHCGWFIEKHVLNTLTQVGDDNIKQRNTTLLVVLRRGSNTDSI